MQKTFYAILQGSEDDILHLEPHDSWILSTIVFKILQINVSDVTSIFINSLEVG
jgi:hypothetical protein